MKKKLIAFLLLLTMVLPMALVVPAKADSQTDYDHTSQIKQLVTQQVDAYTADVTQNNAAVSAFIEYALHAVFGRGKTIVVKESDPIVSTIFNANMFNEALTEVLTNGIIRMQDLNLEEMFVRGTTDWHSFYDSYSFTGYMGRKVDQSKRLSTITSAKSIYGDVAYPGPININDQAMQLIAGGLKLDLTFDRAKVTEDMVTYNVQLYLSDNFDFYSNYSGAEKLGYDATLDRALIKIGRFLNKFLLTNFTWEYTTTLQIEVPYSCNHTTDSYHWTFDAETDELLPVADDEFTVNNTTQMFYTTTSTGAMTPYFKLENPVTLSHEKPWVVEYEAYKIASFALSPLSSVSNSLPYLMQYSRYYTWASSSEYFPLEYYPGTNTAKKLGTNIHYNATKLQNMYKYSSKHTYVYRLENMPAADGSNMIYVSVFDKDLDQTVLAPTPMDDYMVRYHGESTRTLISEADNRISGIDFLINYIGNKSYRITSGTFDLKIWENGVDATDHSSFSTQYKSPTCTEDGGMTHTCTECGYGYLTEVEPATGHSYGDYVSNNNADCEHDGTKTAICIDCGHKDIKTDSGTAIGHNIVEQPTQEATCTEAGITAGSYCSLCYTVFTAQETLPPTGHDWHAANCKQPLRCLSCGMTQGEALGHFENTTPGYEPTCTTPGLTTGAYCYICGKVTTPQEEIPALGHNWSEATDDAPSTCTTCGAENGETHSHDTIVTLQAQPATCTADGLTEGTVCSDCNQVIEPQQTIPALGHTWKAASCTEPQTCITCGEKTGDVIAHTEAIVPGYAPTCTQYGLTDGVVCSACGLTLQEQTTIAATGHTTTTQDAKAPTCTEAGFTALTHCTTCDEVLEAKKEIDALGHEWIEATDEAPATCTICGTTQGSALTVIVEDPEEEALLSKEENSQTDSDDSSDKATTTGSNDASDNAASAKSNPAEAADSSTTEETALEESADVEDAVLTLTAASPAENDPSSPEATVPASNSNLTITIIIVVAALIAVASVVIGLNMKKKK